MDLKHLFRRKTVGAIIREAERGDLEGGHGTGLRRTLTVRDLTFFGIAAVIGTGVFTAIGQASYSGGPGVVFLFIFTGIACGFAAYCYAEFASMVPISGSAYTYAYVAFGELIAWIIGWDLLMEYAIGNIAVAISWSQYFVHVLAGFHIIVPSWMSMDYFTAHSGFNDAVQALSVKGATLASLDEKLQNCYHAWQYAPRIGDFRLIMDVPALGIVFLITAIVYIGIRESRTANNIMVFIKLGIIIVVIVLGAFYVNPVNWNNFTPNGFSGIMSSVSAVFFAYIGFDAISTTAEECKNPQRDLPKAMFNTLAICTTLYVILTLVITGMVNYKDFDGVADPLAYVFSSQGTTITNYISGLISLSAIIVIASVLLVYQMGQPRIWMSMSRDGLLPKAFSRIHPRFKTPSFATIVTGFVVAIPALFLNLDIVISLTSIGTLFAFVLVCAGVLVLQNKKDKPKSTFKTPYINAKWIMPIALIGGVIFMFSKFKNETTSFLTNEKQTKEISDITDSLSVNERETITAFLVKTDSVAFDTVGNDIQKYLETRSPEKLKKTLGSLPLQEEKKFDSGWSIFQHKIPMWCFIIITVIITVLSFIKKLSLIPVLGVLSCLYLMTGESVTNWARFVIWLLVGLVIYFFYSFRNSRLGITPEDSR